MSFSSVTKLIVNLSRRPWNLVEAMELGAYASILAPYEEWEVLTIIRNILTGKKKKRPRKSR
jgi:DNA-binding NtrC family response regulator